MPATGIVKDDFYKQHAMGPFHPECPERLDAIYAMLDERDMRDRFTLIHPREATQEEITAIHTPEYYQLVAETAQRHGLTHLDPDTSACLAAGAGDGRRAQARHAGKPVQRAL